MAIIHAAGGVDLTAPNSVQLKDEQPGFAARAVGCEVVTCTVVVTDRTGSLDFTSFDTWRIRDDAMTAGSRVFWAGFIDEQRIGRAMGGTLIPTGRIWELDLLECNEFVRRRLLLPADGAKRPSETVDDRVAWLLTTVGFTGGLIVDHGLIESSSVPLDDFDFTGSTGQDVLLAVATKCGLTPHLRYREATDDYELIFIDYLRSGLDAVSFKITNAGDDNLSTSWPPNDAVLHRSPSRRASGIGLAYPNGFAYAQDAGTQAVIGDVDRMSTEGDVKTKSAADLLVTRLLGQQSDDEERIDGLTVTLPAANVNDAREGQLIQAKFTHFPGWDVYRYARIIQRIVRRPQNNTQAYYDVDYELVPADVADLVCNARLLGPNDNNMPVGLDGTFDIAWDGNAGDGPSAPPGCPASLTTGLTFQGPSEEWTGIISPGWGTLTVDSVGTFSGAIGGGVVTLTARILLNGAEVYHDLQSTSGGARAISWTWSMLAKTIVVVPGDVISANVTVAGMSGGILVIPAGVGSCTNMLWARGTLIA